jgi:hypothetical protein
MLPTGMKLCDGDASTRQCPLMDVCCTLLYHKSPKDTSPKGDTDALHEQRQLFAREVLAFNMVQGKHT